MIILRKYVLSSTYLGQNTRNRASMSYDPHGALRPSHTYQLHTTAAPTQLDFRLSSQLGDPPNGY